MSIVGDSVTTTPDARVPHRRADADFRCHDRRPAGRLRRHRRCQDRRLHRRRPDRLQLADRQPGCSASRPTSRAAARRAASRSAPPPDVRSASIAGTADHRLKWFGTFRGRVGVLVDPRVLLYVTGGLAYGADRQRLRGRLPRLRRSPASAPSNTKAGLDGRRRHRGRGRRQLDRQGRVPVHGSRHLRPRASGRRPVSRRVNFPGVPQGGFNTPDRHDHRGERPVRQPLPRPHLPRRPELSLRAGSGRRALLSLRYETSEAPASSGAFAFAPRLLLLPDQRR